MRRRREDDSSESEADSEELRVRNANFARAQRGSREEEDFKEEGAGRGHVAEGERRSGRLAEKAAVRKQESEPFLPKTAKTAKPSWR